jgi:hypothetical protein
MTATKQKLLCPFCSYGLEQALLDCSWECLRCGAACIPGEGLSDPFAGWRECYREDVTRQPAKRGGGGSSRRLPGKKVSRQLMTERYRLE